MRHERTLGEITQPTAGERLLYALGQHYLRWHSDPTRYVPPHRLNVLTVARTRWVCAQVEYVQEGEYEDEGVLFLHLPSEVLVIDDRQEFPWRLLDVREWGARQERRDFFRRAA